ncbi:MAG: RNA polymerase sigma factor [Eubacteriales bacterium]
MERLLLKRFKRGDNAAFKTVYEQTIDAALRLAKVIMKHDSLAQDAVQEAYLRAYTYRNRFDEHRPFEFWFNRILVNECRKRLKENKAKWQTAAPEGFLEIGQKDTYDFQEHEEILEALARLPEIYRTPVILKYFNDYSEDQIAEVLSQKKSTVKSRLYEGRQKMKKMLEQAGYGEKSDE